MNLCVILRLRIRDWRTSAAFVTVIALAMAVAGTWLAIAQPLLRGALPFPESERLVAIETSKHGVRGGATWMDLEELRGDSIGSIAGFVPRTWGLQTESHGHVEVVLSQQVTGEFFQTLGVRPALGEILTRGNEQTANQAWVWFSYEAWRRFLGGVSDPSNRMVWINAVAYRVAGVMPESFTFPYRGQSPDIYIPLNRSDYWGSHGAGGLGVIARLKPGVRKERAQSEVDSRASALASQFSASNRDVRYIETDISSYVLGDRLPVLRWLTVAMLVLVLVAVANAGGIWLAQWLRQQRQVSIQLCLGASQGRVWREQAAHVLVLGGAASAVGLLGVSLLLRVLRASPAFGVELARFELWSKASLEPWIVVLLVMLTLTASLISGILPLVTVRGGDPPLGGGRTATARTSRRLRVALAAAQLTLTGALAYAGILIGRNVQILLEADHGFRTEQILVSGIGVSEAKYNTDEKMIGFHQRAIEELKRLPGVVDAAGGISLPVSRNTTRFLLDLENVPRNDQRTARIGVASPGLLPLLGIPVRQGRSFDTSDRWSSAKVALVNQAFVDRFLAAERNPVGHRLRFAFYNGFAAKPYAEHRIIGVIGNTLNRDLAVETEPQILISSDQMAFEGFQYFVRSTLPAAALMRPIQEAVWRVDPEVERVDLTPLADRLEKSLVSRRLIVRLLNVFCGIAILGVLFGLASSLAATFLEMTRDLGIRSALGASAFHLAFESVRWAAAAVTVSWILTLPISIALGRAIVLDRAPAGWDARSWLGASVVLGVIGMAAAFVPARRAASVDPAATLRSD